VVGWLLLRPYRRITQLGGKDSTRAITSAGSWHRLFMRDVRQAAALKVVEAGGTREPGSQRRAAETAQTQHRPEARSEDSVSVTTSGTGTVDRPETGQRRQTGQPRRSEPRWEAPDTPAENAPSYSIYRPDSERRGGEQTPARRPESASLPG
jgi:hypothetical protein